jgi:hypothetical protein
MTSSTIRSLTDCLTSGVHSRRDVEEKRSCHRWGAARQALWEATTALLSQMMARFQQTTRPGIELVQNLKVHSD